MPKTEPHNLRSDKHIRFDLIPREALDRMALRFEFGEPRWGAAGFKVMPADFKRITLNHLIDHVLAYKEHGDDASGADDLGAILANAAMLAYYEAHHMASSQPLEPGFYSMEMTDVAEDGTRATMLVSRFGSGGADARKMKVKLRS